MLPLRATALVFFLLLPRTPGALGGERAELERCEARFAAHPEAEEAAKCFYRARATARLAELLARHPELPWLHFYLGSAKWESPEAEGLYRAAAGRFAEGGEVGGEVRARVNLGDRLRHKSRFEEAALEERRAIRLAEASGSPELAAYAKILAVRALMSSGRDLSGAGRLLAQARRDLFPQGADSYKKEWLFTSGEANLQLGRLESAERSFRRLAELARGTRDSYKTHTAQYGLLRVLMERAAEEPGAFGQEILRTQARATLASAQGDASTERWTQFILGQLTDGAESREHFARCVEKSAALARASFCQAGEARKLAEVDPRRAQEILRQAWDRAKEEDDPWSRLFLLGDQMRVSWRALPRPQAIADAWRALDAIEALRRAQGPASQAGLFSTWSDDYYWFSGRLLEPAERSPDDVAQAFAVTERLRGRTLLEKLAGVRPESPSKAVLARRLPGLVEAIRIVAARVDAPQLPRRERENAREDLAALGIERAEAERQLAMAESRPGGADPFASLDEVRRALERDEALLSFQVAPRTDWTGGFGGGAWLTVATRGAVRVYPLPGREELRRQVERLIRPLEAYEVGPDEARSLAALYQALLAPALAELPPGIERLVLVPDDELHQLPFAALRPDGSAPPLAARYQITVAPSATLWRQWRRQAPLAAPVPALVLADPARLGRLPRLPLAVEEGQAVVQALGGHSVLRTGEDASEEFLKRADLRPYRILHFATHSVSRGESSERSSVLLTPGGGEDGRLGEGEILALGLGGKVVVLSACMSARGKILRGEGVLSLARAFFLAGAPTVVGSLWPVEDLDGKRLFERFYHHLGRGASVAAALRAAQRDRIAAGEKLRAWAGFVVLGDGDLVPMPAPKGRRTGPTGAAGASPGRGRGSG